MDLYGRSSDLQKWPDNSAHPTSSRLTHGPLVQFIAASLFGVIGVALLHWVSSGGRWDLTIAWALGLYLGAVTLTGYALHRTFPHPRIGMCNVVTLARLVLTSVVFAALFTPAIVTWTIFVIATLAFALDGLDGWLARRAGLVSAFGARFDMEVDSALALILAVMAFQNGAGAFVLLLGLPRYAFGLAQIWMPFLAGPLADRFSRKVVCVLQISALLILLLPWVEPRLAQALAGVTALALLWSFTIDVRSLWRARQ